MNSIGAGPRRKRSRDQVFPLVVFAIALTAIAWAFGALFPAELQQVVHWVVARFEAIRG